MSCGRPPSKPLPAGVSQGNQPSFDPQSNRMGTAFPAEDGPARHVARGQQKTARGRPERGIARESPSSWLRPSLEHAVPELAVMANVLNPETESITLNTELETPTLEPATELEQLASIDQPSRESTSNPEPSATEEVTPLDADALTQPAVETELPAVEAELPAVEEELSAAPATTPEETPAVAAVMTYAGSTRWRAESMIFPAPSPHLSASRLLKRLPLRPTATRSSAARWWSKEKSF